MDALPPLNLDADTLKALAHPLRVRLLEVLHRDGPSTATALAAHVGENSGATSYHLRQLHAVGLIEEDRERGTRRERWWRFPYKGLRLRGSDLPDDPATRAATAAFVREVARRRAAWIADWHESAMDWPANWRDSSMDSDWTLRMSPEQLAALRDEVFAVIERHRNEIEGEEDADEAERVVVMFHAFPQHTAPTPTLDDPRTPAHKEETS